MANSALDQFVTVYLQLHKDNLQEIRSIYCEDIVFVDALHEVHGLSAVEDYFAKLYRNLKSCQFDVLEQYQVEENAFLRWNLHFSHGQLARGETITVAGFTHIKFRHEKVFYHRDYTDLGQMLYEHIPVLGTVVRAVKTRARG